MSPVPVRQRGDPAAYNRERELAQPLQPTPAGQAGSPAAVPPQSSAVSGAQQGAGSLTADLPSGQQQAESFKVSNAYCGHDGASLRPADLFQAICRLDDSNHAVLTHQISSMCAGVAAQRVVSDRAGDPAEC